MDVGDVGLCVQVARGGGVLRVNGGGGDRC